MMVGQNTVSGQMLTSFIERIETIRTQKKDLAADERAVVAEAVSNGFQAGAIRHVIKLREMKPHDREEAEAVRDGYLHALGMIHDTPVFRQVGLINVDIASRESVIEALKAFVPEKGSIVVEAGGKPVRLTRADDGTVTASEVIPVPPPGAERPSELSPAQHRDPPPDVDDAGAEMLGAQAFKDNVAIVKNPFPFGDGRRPRWDEGWRRASGTDGMGKP